MLVVMFFALAGCAAVKPVAPPPVAQADLRYEFDRIQKIMTARDGTEIAVTLYLPRAKTPGEKFPVLLGMNPYRKDDLFIQRDYSLYSYFAERGFLLARADVRGTGGSSGPVPVMEYSDAELDDGVQLIEWLAALPESNGKVGMWGLSWSGFNSLQVAMRSPPALKAILAVHASDDLYRDDIHYVDGIFHMDEYMMDMDHEVALPRTPGYAIDAAYIKDRFESLPWIFTYLRERRDGPFWRVNSLRWQYEKLQIPTLLIGGLLDSYRDSVPRILKEAKAPVEAVIGPWIHTWPDKASPGPTLEWRDSAVLFWNRHLRGQAFERVAPPGTALVFLRGSYRPSLNVEEIPGAWCMWKESDTLPLTYFFAKDTLSTSEPETPGFARLIYEPANGGPLGYYWGELTGPMKNEGLSFTSAPLEQELRFAGFPELRLRAASTEPLVHWVARLEDVFPDGTVAHVTGAALNGSQRLDRLNPSAQTGEMENFSLPLHFSSWAFPPGHRVRITLDHAAFPMLWPTPYPKATSRVELAQSSLSLPLLPKDTPCVPGDAFKAKIPRPVYPDPAFSADESTGGWPSDYKEFRKGSWHFADAKGRATFQLGEWGVEMKESGKYGVNTVKPSEASYQGRMEHAYKGPGRAFTLRTELGIRSDATFFHVKVQRVLERPGQPPLKKEWDEKIPRDFH